MTFLHRFDAAYYRRWAERTLQFAGDAHRAWLPMLRTRYQAVVEYLVEQPRTVIHGDYYADNTLYRDGIIYPLDWEREAVAVGEIDLASLTNGWHAELVEACEREYRQVRWPDGAPAEFCAALSPFSAVGGGARLARP